MARRPEHSFMQQSLVASFMEQDENLSVLGKSKINASRIGGQAKFDLTKPDMSIRGNATGDLFLLCLNEFDFTLNFHFFVCCAKGQKISKGFVFPEFWFKVGEKNNGALL